MILVLQFKRGLGLNEPTFMVILVVETEGTTEFFPVEIQRVLEEYREVMPESLPKTLPPRRGIDHEVRLMPGLKPPAKNAYKIAPLELAVL